ncbi:MAG: protein kinase [Myxococcales bacterium]|nr:protein kinase [Myxococcales bacterium]
MERTHEENAAAHDGDPPEDGEKTADPPADREAPGNGNIGAPPDGADDEDDEDDEDGPDGVDDEDGADSAAVDRTFTLNAPDALRPHAGLQEPAAGTVIGNYQIRNVLGRGGSGVVMLAREKNLNRSAALKLIAKGPHSARFMTEARIIAMLHHPNIVNLWDYGEDGGLLYLALQYVEGTTLQERMREAAMAPDECFRVLRDIADALEHAHANNVVHCDLKPSNVMIGRDGCVRVVDFGIAQTESAGAAGGTPDWMAPEQARRPAVAALTDRVDTWALGLLAYQLLTGEHALGATAAERRALLLDDSREPELCMPSSTPPLILDLVARALRRTPELRPSMAECKRVLGEVIDGRGEGFFEDGPYPGISPFDEERARFFFGRDDEVNAFLDRLRHVPCLPIGGPSGVGKSSFLHAGVVPRLRARERWLVLSVRPGDDPVGALARELVRAAAPITGPGAGLEVQRQQMRELRADLLETPALLAGRLATLAALHRARVLLAVDQLEEAFTQCTSAHERGQFLTMLLDAVDHPSDPMRIVFTVRDDHVGKLPVREVYMLPPLRLSHLRRTIVEPLGRCQYKFDDPAVVDDLIREAGASSSADLPLLQFACRMLWDGRDRATRTLLRSTYNEMGGVAGALARYADRAVSALNEHDGRTARALLLQLVSGATRRTVPRERLLELVGGEAGPLIDRLLAARLLVQRTEEDAQGPVIEIAHESLLHKWGQLSRWLRESQAERQFLDKLDEDASLWEKRGKLEADTYRRDQLVGTRQVQRELGVTLSERLEGFVAAGEARVRAGRRRRRIRILAALAVLLLTSIPLLVAVVRYLAREALIDVNAGTVELAITAYDWVEGRPRPVPIGELPELTVRLFGARQGGQRTTQDLEEPGEPLPVEMIRIEREPGDLLTRVDRVTAPGGLVFLEITGRGRRGQSCAASWIRLQAFPGYGGKRRIPRWNLEVPTCQSSAADMVEIEAGRFVYGGPGESPSRWWGEPDYDQPEVELELPAFAMDRTEVSNARFAPFARIEHLTGYPAPVYSNEPLHDRDADPQSPVTEINAFHARAFCRYLGKDLPTDHQWVKAARGGLTVRGKPNPMPRRLFPWGAQLRRECVNLLDPLDPPPEDGFGWVAPVDAFACGASPYGILNLSGNVQEPISRVGQADLDNPHHIMRGGGPDSPPELEHGSTIFINHRNPRNFNYTIGVRCAGAPVK